MERRSISTKSRNLDFYLEKIEDFKWVEFDCLKVFCTAGDIRPPYPHQWVAYTKVREGEDDPFEGVGRTPLEAIRDLYRILKESEEHLEGDNETTSLD